MDDVATQEVWHLEDVTEEWGAGRGAQEGRAAAWLQHGGSGVGPIVDLEWAKSEQRSGNCIGNKC
ncbi:hypothetical protein DV515_00014491 [Chloebia gouldiae]|uniref:Uncharacterized protein n=1 Tax=Chloebia gouldiae TaxID=44316 RepID=A0A3L8RY90_CHLGU|nr:hypothetical protein DV515_00014491 [Chloebia gouldiae]